jgi:hypothetical protein
MKRWLIGGLIGFLISLLILFFLFSSSMVVSGSESIVFKILGYPFEIILIIFGDTFTFRIIALIFYFIVYILVGALIGFIIDRMKKPHPRG